MSNATSSSKTYSGSFGTVGAVQPVMTQYEFIKYYDFETNEKSKNKEQFEQKYFKPDLVIKTQLVNKVAIYEKHINLVLSKLSKSSEMFVKALSATLLKQGNKYFLGIVFERGVPFMDNIISQEASFEEQMEYFNVILNTLPIILKGLYMTSINGVVNGDIKFENMVIVDNKLKFIDLGGMVSGDEIYGDPNKHMIMTFPYMSTPQIFIESFVKGVYSAEKEQLMLEKFYGSQDKLNHSCRAFLNNKNTEYYDLPKRFFGNPNGSENARYEMFKTFQEHIDIHILGNQILDFFIVEAHDSGLLKQTLLQLGGNTTVQNAVDEQFNVILDNIQKKQYFGKLNNTVLNNLQQSYNAEVAQSVVSYVNTENIQKWNYKNYTKQYGALVGFLRLTLSVEDFMAFKQSGEKGVQKYYQTAIKLWNDFQKNKKVCLKQFLNFVSLNDMPQTPVTPNQKEYIGMINTPPKNALVPASSSSGIIFQSM